MLFSNTYFYRHNVSQWQGISGQFYYNTLPHRESELSAWHSAFLYNKFVEKGEVWNITLRVRMP